MSSSLELKVNGRTCPVATDPATPLLYVLRNALGLKGPRFGCGLAQCGACTVHVNGSAVRSCVLPVGAVGATEITTLEGLARDGQLHPVQAAFVDEQAAQCGYCLNGWIMTAAAFLRTHPRATDTEIAEALGGLQCRCGTHMSLLRAVKRAAVTLAAEATP